MEENKRTDTPTKHLNSQQTPSRKPSIMPIFKAVIPINASTDYVITMFKKACRKHDFYISQVQNSTITAIHTRRPKWTQIFSCLVSSDKMHRNSSIIKLQMTADDRNCTRILVIKGVQGLLTRISDTIYTFKNWLEAWLTKPNISGWVQRANSEVDIQPSITCKVESYSYYELSKILSSQQYGVGKMLFEFIQEWRQKHSQTAQSAQILPRPLVEIKNLIDHIVSNLLQYFNIQNIGSTKMMQYCRPAVQKYIYSKLMTRVLELYQNKFNQREQLYQTRAAFVNQSSKFQLLQNLGVKQKFRLVQAQAPYGEAIQHLRSLCNQSTPLEKLNVVLQGFTLMKTCVVDYWKGREELETMDDQLPIIIYCVSQILTPGFATQVMFLQDYVSNQIGFDNEYHLLVHIDSAISYIIYEWTN